jgi:glycosyltransferase involved in cell wall biosynthesis
VRDKAVRFVAEHDARTTVAFCGTRGVPANYGGFETAVDEISRRFVEHSYKSVVFCRGSSEEAPASHEGRRLIYVKGSSLRALDTFVSAFQTGWHLLRHRREYDHVFWFNNANLPGILLTLLARIPVSINTDGLEWRRAKWSWPFKAYYFVASLLVSLLCAHLISDSRAIQAYYDRVFAKKTQFVPYGVPRTPPISREKEASILKRYRLKKGAYFLQITRFEPDNLPLNVAESFRAARLGDDGFKLLLVGYQRGTPYAQRIKEMSGGNGILVADALYDAEALAVLRENCFCYVHGNSVGGTNPALLEAMATCPRVSAIEGPFSREVLGHTGSFFAPEDLAVSLRETLGSPDASEDMRIRVRSLYRWDEVANAYMRLARGKPAAYAATDPLLDGQDELLRLRA